MSYWSEFKIGIADALELPPDTSSVQLVHAVQELAIEREHLRQQVDVMTKTLANRAFTLEEEVRNL